MSEIRLSDHFGYGRLIRFTLPTIAMMLCTFQSFLVVAERPKLGFVVSVACLMINRKKYRY